VRRIGEQQKIQENQQMIPADISNPHRKLHLSGPLPHNYVNCQQYKWYLGKETIISCCKGDNCFEVDDEIVLVRNILCSADETYIVYEPFEKKEPFFQYPLPSVSLGIYLVSQLSGQVQVTPVCRISKKMILLPFQQFFVVFPQLHSY
jgi:hypothetical protein